MDSTELIYRRDRQETLEKPKQAQDLA